MAVAADLDTDRSNSQTVRAQLAVRDLVLTGTLKPGERVSEVSLVNRIGVSRTPVRAALHRLAEEGLLEPLPAGGFAIKEFTDREVLDSIEIRGVLEGLAARLAAERGVSLTAIAPLRRCLADLDEVVAQTGSSVEVFSEYVALNARFHSILVGLADSRPLERQIERAITLPFASPSAFVMVQSTMPEARTILTIAQDHHRCVLDAIEQREGARAESLMREHSRLASRNLALALRNQSTMDLVPGSALIRSSSIA
jgi:GntR family transcriptional regulator of vanillate catabolism